MRKLLVIPTLLGLIATPGAMALPSQQSFLRARCQAGAAPPRGQAVPGGCPPRPGQGAQERSRAQAAKKRPGGAAP